jgi:hypothetical protein
MLTRYQVLRVGSTRWTGRSRNTHWRRMTPPLICKLSYIVNFRPQVPQLRSQPFCYSYNSDKYYLAKNYQVYSTDFASSSRITPSHLIALIAAANNTQVCQLRSPVYLTIVVQTLMWNLIIVSLIYLCKNK